MLMTSLAPDASALGSIKVEVEAEVSGQHFKIKNINDKRFSEPYIVDGEPRD